MASRGRLADAGGLRGTGRRSGSVTERNFATISGRSWGFFLGGLAEPFLYLFSVGYGLGARIGFVPLSDGHLVTYAAFVAPAMLAASAMNATFAAIATRFFGLHRFVRLYDTVIATPVRPIEIALGEIAWSVLCGAVYSTSFVTLMVLMDLTTWPRALLALPASLLIGAAFGGAGVIIATFMRGWPDFSLVYLAQFVLFLLSGTFVPPQHYPVVIQWLMYASPLYQSINLLRAITLGTGNPANWLVSLAYLAVFGVVGIAIAARRVNRMLYV
ncbi:ABC transporter permease [Luedemannella flava]